MDPAVAFYLILMNVGGDFVSPLMVDGPYTRKQCSDIGNRLMHETGPGLVQLGEMWQCQNYEFTQKAMTFNRCTVRHGPTPSPDGGKMMTLDCPGPQLIGNLPAPPPPNVAKPPT